MLVDFTKSGILLIDRMTQNEGKLPCQKYFASNIKGKLHLRNKLSSNEKSGKIAKE